MEAEKKERKKFLSMAALASTSTMWGEYMLQFNSLCNAAEKKISIGSDAQAELEQAQKALKSLEIEARKVNGAEKKAAKAEVLKLKNRLSSLKRQCLLGPSASVSTGVNSTNTKSMSAGGRGSTERERMAAATAKARKTTQRLEEARKALEETESVAASTMDELHRNRETIERSTARAAHTNSQMNVAQSITYKMSRWWRNL